MISDYSEIDVLNVRSKIGDAGCLSHFSIDSSRKFEPFFKERPFFLTSYESNMISYFKYNKEYQLLGFIKFGTTRFENYFQSGYHPFKHFICLYLVV